MSDKDETELEYTSSTIKSRDREQFYWAGQKEFDKITDYIFEEYKRRGGDLDEFLDEPYKPSKIYRARKSTVRWGARFWEWLKATWLKLGVKFQLMVNRICEYLTRLRSR